MQTGREENHVKTKREAMLLSCKPKERPQKKSALSIPWISDLASKTVSNASLLVKLSGLWSFVMPAPDK